MAQQNTWHNYVHEKSKTIKCFNIILFYSTSVTKQRNVKTNYVTGFYNSKQESINGLKKSLGPYHFVIKLNLSNITSHSYVTNLTWELFFQNFSSCK